MYRPVTILSVLATPASDAPQRSEKWKARREYDIAGARMGFGDGELVDMTRTALGAAFADDALKADLLARL